MKHTSRLLLVMVLIAALLPIRTVSAQAALPPVDPCPSFALPGGQAFSGTAPSGSVYCITLPPITSLQDLHGLVIFAHGYVFAYPPGLPPLIPYSQMLLTDPDTQVTTTIPAVVNSMGFVFATTSYSQNGLAVKQGVENVVELVEVVKSVLLPISGLPELPPFPVFLIGASEGGLVTTLAVEKHPEVFTGGVATCGPVGDFSKQVNYWGDFRLLFDYYFPKNLLQSSPFAVPAEVMDNWGTLTAPGSLMLHTASLVQDDLDKGGVKVKRLLTAAQAPIDPFVPDTIFKTVLGILDYNVMATNQALAELGGNPFSNLDKTYTAFPKDPTLNKKITRIAPDQAALDEINADYQTSGALQRPLVLMHTIGDPIVPVWHMALYKQKAYQQGSLNQLVAIPIVRYGHCQFTPAEAVFAFNVMLIKAAAQGLSPAQVQAALPDQQSQDALLKLKVDFAEVTR